MLKKINQWGNRITLENEKKRLMFRKKDADTKEMGKKEVEKDSDVVLGCWLIILYVGTSIIAAMVSNL